MTSEIVAARRGRDAIWAAALKLVEFGLKDLPATVTAQIAKRYLRKLVQEGYVEVIDPQRPLPRGGWTAGRYRVIRQVRTAPMDKYQSGIKNTHLWNAMRVLKFFTVRELAITSCTPTVTISEANTRGYLRYLALAGYLALAEKSRIAHPATWRFVRNTGPLAPVIQQGKNRPRQVYDRNLNQIMWTQGGGHG
ncbi:MAG: hypothetical protein OEW11_09690 [Nitrospirota bacterium]|nr:hypothetical protein [Nitrospirota bacterium]